jgi:hypothetical protein
MDSRVKQPSESRLYNMDFDELLEETGETIATVESIVASKTGLTLGPPAISGSKVQFRISGGMANNSYIITVKVTTSLGNTLEGEGLLKVREI